MTTRHSRLAFAPFAAAASRSIAIEASRRSSADRSSRAATLEPASWNSEARTIDVVWTTGARGARFDFDQFGMVDEELDTSRDCVRLSRLNGGAPVLNSHQRGQLGDQIGVVVPGSARMQDGQGIATLQLSAREEIAPLIADIAAGIIRNVSVGYTVHRYDVEKREGHRPLYRAVDWEPFEISFVAVPFDAQAQVRSGLASTETSRIITSKDRKMNANTGWLARFLGSRSADAGTMRDAPQQLEELAIIRRQDGPATIAQLREIARDASEDGIPLHLCNDLAFEIAERGLTEAEARSAFLQVLGERQRNETSHIRGSDPETPRRFAAAGAIVGSGHQSHDDPAFHARGIGDAIFARMSGSAPADHARQFMSMSMVQLAGEMLERQGMRGINRMGANEVLEAAAWNSRATRALASRGGDFATHTTSDFPELLLEAGNRFLLQIFEAASSPLKQVSRQRSARDFRHISGIELSGFGTLPKVPESGEIKHGSFKSRAESYALETFAKQFALSRQAIINDDLGAFGDPVRIMARAAAETEATLFADLLNSNPMMVDAELLFSTAHGNVAEAASHPSMAALDAARLAMRSQKDLDGVTPLNVVPEYIVAGPKHETLIDQLLATVTATSVAEVNAFAGKLKPLIDVRLTGNAWYLFAGTGSAPVFEHAYLDGNSGPRVDMEEGWDVLGQKYRVYMDFGAGVIDYRGGFKNPGVA